MGPALSLASSERWGRRSTEEDRVIKELVEAKQWHRLMELLEGAPDYAKQRNKKTGLLPLHWAISKQAPVEMVRLLLSLYPAAVGENDSEESKKKPLHLAAIYCSKDEKPLVLEAVLDQSLEFANVGDDEWCLPLHLAAQNRASKRAIQILLLAHPDGAGRRCKATKLPLHMACEYRAPYDSIVELLEAYPLGVKESSGLRYPLHFACENKGSLEVIKALLDKYPDAVFARSGKETTLPLHLAAANKAGVDVIELVLQFNPSAIVDRDSTMRLPLHHALERNAPDETVLFLVKTCPETANVQGFFPHLPLHIALERNFSCKVIDALLQALPNSSQKRDAFGILPLRRAIKSRMTPDVVLSLLRDDNKSKAATKELDEYERLPLHYACARAMPFDVVQALIDAFPEGARVPDKNGQLPLHLSVMRSAEIDIVRLLVKTFPEAVISKDNYNYIPLHHAIEIGASEEIYQHLLEVDKRCSEMPVDGRLPLHFAIETKRSPAAIDMILKAFPKAARVPEKSERSRIALQQALERRHPLSVLQALVDAYPGECSIYKDNTGRLAAHYCVEFDAPVEILRRLVVDNPSVVQLKELDFYYYRPTELGNEIKMPNGPKQAIRPTKRRPGKQLLHYATEDMGARSALVEEIIMAKDGGLLMPVSASTGALNPYHGHGWTYLLCECEDKYADVVESILERYGARSTKSVQILCDAPDELGRSANLIASPECRRLLHARLHYFARYEFIAGPAAHESENSIVKFATDHGRIDGKRMVVLKFLKNRDQFEREVNLRTRVNLSDDFIIPALESHDGDADPRYRAETLRKGFSEYPYCVATAAGERDLLTIIQRERIAGHDYSRIQPAALQVLKCVKHLHDFNLIHGDLKPSNVVRHAGKLKLIDLGASVFFGAQAGTSKISSAYMPPEMVYHPPLKFIHEHSDDTDEHSTAPPQTAFDQSSSPSYSLSSSTGQPVNRHGGGGGEGEGRLVERIESIPAQPSIDMWAFGVLLFYLCTGETLLHCTVEDKIDSTQKNILSSWDEHFTFQRLALVSNPLARNLILQLLSKNPSRRPNVDAALAHPFFTTHSPETLGLPVDLPFRFQGMSPKFDVCICYRKFTERMRMKRRAVANGNAEEKDEEENALTLKQLLMDSGLTVCLCDDDCSGLVNSRACCILLSRGSINDPRDDLCNFPSISNDSYDLDDFFLAIRMATELTHHGLLEHGIFAVLVGDRAQKTSVGDDVAQEPIHYYEPYFAVQNGELLGRWGGSHPLQLCNESIHMVERRICSLLQGYCLGACPILQDATTASVHAIMHTLTWQQNIHVVGEVGTAWTTAATEVVAGLSILGGGDVINDARATRVENPGVGETGDDPDEGVQEANQRITEATVALLKHKVEAKELDIQVLQEQIERDRHSLAQRIKQLQHLKYKYSVHDPHFPTDSSNHFSTDSSQMVISNS